MIPIEVSAHHVHLSKNDLELLFGESYELTPERQLTQPGEFAAEEKVDLKTEKGEIKKVRIVGPLRDKTQIELSYTDSIRLGLKVPLRRSGDLENSAGVTLINNGKELKIEEGVIIPWRHIHMNPEEAKELGVENNQLVSVEVKGERSLTFHKVQVRVGESYKLSMHVDTDEGNAASIDCKGKGELLL